MIKGYLARSPQLHPSPCKTPRLCAIHVSVPQTCQEPNFGYTSSKNSTRTSPSRNKLGRHLQALHVRAQNVIALACKYSTGSPDTGGKPVRSVAGHNILKGLHQPLDSVHRTVLPSSEGRALMELVVESSEAHVARLQKGLVPDRTKTVAPPQLISSKSGFHPKVRQHSASGTKTILGHGTNAEQYY
ncbi:unnamed protein product [Sphagnum jensenii]|uniref:Uncharacterized protein n=1 Tax=Sphagnum jensenii TaxID=128206 RepID=A0ABP1B0I0_9BRYO